MIDTMFDLPEFLPENWQIDSPAAAEWAMSKIREERACRDRIVEAAQGMIDYYEAQIKRANEKCAAEEGYFMGQLRIWFDQQPKRELKASYAVDLPSGKLSIERAGKVEFTQDKPRLAAWLVESASEYVKFQATADWAELKKHVTVANGLPVLDTTGEVIDGLTVMEHEPEFKITLR